METLSEQQLDTLRLIAEEEEVEHSTLDARTKASLIKRKLIKLRPLDGDVRRADG